MIDASNDVFSTARVAWSNSSGLPQFNLQGGSSQPDADTPDIKVESTDNHKIESHSRDLLIEAGRMVPHNMGLLRFQRRTMAFDVDWSRKPCPIRASVDSSSQARRRIGGVFEWILIASAFPTAPSWLHGTKHEFRWGDGICKRKLQKLLIMFP